MAGDWIKVEHATPDKPEVVRMAGILGIDQDAVSGKLLRLWVWADLQSVNGNGLSVTNVFIDRITFCVGFADALRTVGWLDGRDGHLLIPNFERHNGHSAKQRANTAKRVQKSRQPSNDVEGKCNAASVTKSLPEKRREEKRREEVKEGDHAPTAGLSEASVVAEEWNLLGKPFQPIRQLTTKRVQTIKTRLKNSFWRDNWRAAMALIPQSKFLRGETDGQWRANFDWFTRPDTVAKIIEGQYADGGSGPRVQGGGTDYDSAGEDA